MTFVSKNADNPKYKIDLSRVEKSITPELIVF